MTRECGVATIFGDAMPSGILTLHCPADKVHALAVLLREAGADTVSVLAPDYVFTRENALFARLDGAL